MAYARRAEARHRLAAGNRIGGVKADAAFSGLAGAGLYQFSVTIPKTTGIGDQAVQATHLPRQQAP